MASPLLAPLSHGNQKLLDIALALVRLEPRVLLLTEPTARHGARKALDT